MKIAGRVAVTSLDRSAARRLAATGVLLAVLSSCSLGDKQEQAEYVRASLVAARGHDLVAEVTFALTLDDTGFGGFLASGSSESDESALGDLAEQFGGSDAVASLTGTRLRSVAELEPSESKIALTVGDDDERSAVFIGDEVYVKRQNARESERRVWAVLDTEGLDFDRGLQLDELSPAELLRATATALSPMTLLELIGGALSGSMEVRGEEPIGDVATTHYAFNLSFDKAVDELDFDDEARRVRLGLFRQLGMTKDVVHGEAWVDDDGLLRRFLVELPMRVSRLATHDLAVTIELAVPSRDVFVVPPAADQTVEYESLGRLVRSGIPEGL